MRTRLGSQHKSITIDGGESWTRPEPTVLIATTGPSILSQVPTTGDILAIGNNNLDTPRIVATATAYRRRWLPKRKTSSPAP